MFEFLRGIGGQRKRGAGKRSAYDELVRQETEYQLRINEMNRKIEKQQQRLQEILDQGKRETSDIVKLGLAEQYARGERQVRRLLDRRKMLVKAQELVEVQLANVDLQDAIPQEILGLQRPDAQRERALVDVIRDRLDQAYDEMLAGFESSAAENQRDSHEKAAIQSALELFERERDEEIRVALHAIEQELQGTAAYARVSRLEEQAGEIE
jgi:hypothetical protein